MGEDAPVLRSMVDPDVAINLRTVAHAVEETFPEALGVWIYGSFADGYARRDSDVDVAILPDRPLDAWERLERADEVTARLDRKVDLVDLRSVPPLLQFEVFSTGVRVAARDPRSCDFFETRSISAYQRLNVERREVLQAIRDRGTVY
jgi:predicted nucleotidyltransferase